MSENKFLNYIMVEGILSIITGLFILLAPKITELSFGFTLCISYLIYGLYKIITGYLNKNVTKFYFNEILTGIIITNTGVLLFFTPIMNIMHIIALLGIYLIFQSISSSAFSFRIKNSFNIWWINLVAAFFELFLSIFVIISLSSSALWFAGILTGIDLLMRGIIYINLRLSKN